MTALLPSLTIADPAVAGEGSLDPLGLGAIAERLGDLLLPSVTNRMRRPRLLTAITIGAIASDGLEETEPPADGRSSPSICFEWLLLESFLRRRHLLGTGDLDGVPGSAKVTAAIDKDERLAAGNYLKTPNVFGFTGVLAPLARATGLIDGNRRAAEQSVELARVWERDQGFDGFVDGIRGSDGAALRRDIRRVVEQSLRDGRCAVSPGSHLLGKLAGSLRSTGALTTERSWLLQAILRSGDEIGAEIGHALQRSDGATGDLEVAERLRRVASSPLALRLDAVNSYEAVATRLEAVLRQWQYLSTQRGTTPVTAAEVCRTEPVELAAASLPDAIRRARDTLGSLDLAVSLQFESLVAPIEMVTGPGDLADAVMSHHEAVQGRKLPHGKRPWFEPAGTGHVVRTLYRVDDPAVASFEHFGRLYRLATFDALLKDLR